VKVERYVYRLDCGEIYSGPKGLDEGAPADCPLHGESHIAGFGISMFHFLNPDYAPVKVSAAV
jgi:hypothetical protein